MFRIREVLSGLVPLALMGVFWIASPGCRSRKSDAASEAVGIGFNLTDDPRIARGVIVTEPRGREEAFLSFVAGSSSPWVVSCEKQTGGSPVVFSFKTGHLGRVQPAPLEADASARARCMAVQATSTASDALLPDTLVTVQITLRAAR